MLAVKNSSTKNEPDPAGNNNPPAKIIFMDVPEEPTQPETAEQEKKVDPNYQLSQRIQGGLVGFQQDTAENKDPLDTLQEPAPEKTSLTTKTSDTSTDQTEALSTINKSMNYQKDEQQSLLQTTATDFDNNNHQKLPKKTLPPLTQPHVSPLLPDDNKSVLSQPIAKINSVKHRPLEQEPYQPQLQESVVEIPLVPQKTKLSLVDIQKGFAQFMQNHQSPTPAPSTATTLGNSLYFSAVGTSDKDDIAGLKFASYMNQAGKMYQSCGGEYVDLINTIINREGVPSKNNQIAITIDRSGKLISCITTLSCGNPIIDGYHIKMVESIGDFPPIPKYIQAPLQVYAHIPFEQIKQRYIKRAYR